MPDLSNVDSWTPTIRERYENYLKTSFFFKDTALRNSFQSALREQGALTKGPYPEPARAFRTGLHAHELANHCFRSRSHDLVPALLERPLYDHQESAIRLVHLNEQNIVVATGTASGKTESFLYPILFELYRQHLAGQLHEPGVRAMILYPMNALANDQRERLGGICKKLSNTNSAFKPTFGQYIGETPENERDHRRNAEEKLELAQPGELIFREQMRDTPPNILMTNYSMLEYLLIRPDDSPLFDYQISKHWQFIVLDEAHQYRGAKGMEMGMLIRRLKQRLRDGGRTGTFRCIATSATMSSDRTEKDSQAVADFATALFGESFAPRGVIFGNSMPASENRQPGRYHVFLRALEGAFLTHRNGTDAVVLNRKGIPDSNVRSVALEIALCRECGQHYYVGRIIRGRLKEAIRDPSHPDFGVEYYLPAPDKFTHMLCRRCGSLCKKHPSCKCEASIPVKKCKSHPSNPDQLKKCENCEYERRGVGDPVQEIVHGSDGPNAVIATVLHELLPETDRKVLAFADSRQEAAFFAWYVEDSYENVRNRNLILRAMKQGTEDPDGFSIDALKNRLLKEWHRAHLFKGSDDQESKDKQVLIAILRESLTDEKRLSLSGVGLLKWFVKLPSQLELPNEMAVEPWNLTKDESLHLVAHLLDTLRQRLALELPSATAAPTWDEVAPQRRQMSYSRTRPHGRSASVREWGGRQSAIVKHLLSRLIGDCGLTEEDKLSHAVNLMKNLWNALRNYDRTYSPADDWILSSVAGTNTFRLNSRWIRVKLVGPDEVWECGTCGSIAAFNIRHICTRNGCPGHLTLVNKARLNENHYRLLYKSSNLPSVLRAEEHTAQINSQEARKRQDLFKKGSIHLLSSSTTFEVGVDLGNLDVVFLRNVPPEAFSYTQRVGRAGRRAKPGLALTYCRRNPHDLYHFEDPEDRVLRGAIRPPSLRMTNEKIILRHMVATALSAFFKVPENRSRFESLGAFVCDWNDPSATRDLRRFCSQDKNIRYSMDSIVPATMHGQMGLIDDTWIDKIAGKESHLRSAEVEACADRNALQKLIDTYIAQQKYDLISRLGRSKNTIEREQTLNFLSRKAVVPKYGFPIDVVELDTRARDGQTSGVSLQRDLSQAIAEYAPGGTVVANKLEWKSCGVKIVPEKDPEIRYYSYDKARNFTQSNTYVDGFRRYFIPRFGFVTPLLSKPKAPARRSQRLYTTRPFFRGFAELSNPPTKNILGVQVTRALPGILVILCEGRHRRGFFMCLTCGAHMTKEVAVHKAPSGAECKGTLGLYSLGHELPTDVVKLKFVGLVNEADTYSVGYGVLLGVAKTLDVPATDLNVTITGEPSTDESAIILYDNVPGGAGLVARLEHEETFKEALENARGRVMGACGCDSSCYGCLRSYRNQFAHSFLDRTKALDILRRHS